MKTKTTLFILFAILFNISFAQINFQKFSIGYDNLFLTRGDKTANYFNIGYSLRLNNRFSFESNVGYGVTGDLLKSENIKSNSTLIINYQGRIRTDLYMANIILGVNIASFSENRLYFQLGGSVMQYNGVSIKSTSSTINQNGLYKNHKIELNKNDELLFGSYIGLKYDQYLSDQLTGEVKLIRTFYNKGYGNWHLGVGIALNM